MSRLAWLALWGGVILAALLGQRAGAVPALPEPGFPYLTATLSATGMATTAVSVTVYQPSGSAVGPLTEWGLSVKAISTAPFFEWAVDLQLSNDGLTWTTILRHWQGMAPNQFGQGPNGTIIWGAHRRARSARLQLTKITTGVVVTATTWGEP